MEIVVYILNIFKNVGIDAGYFTKQFCLRKDEFHIQRMSKKAKEQSKMQRKNWEQLEKTILIKIKKENTFFMKLVHFKKQWFKIRDQLDFVFIFLKYILNK